MTRSSESTSAITSRVTVTPAACRRTLGLFATGVTVVTARDPADDQIRGMTANAFMSVSLDPPLVVVSIRRAAHIHDRVTAAGAYGVSLLGESMEREARRFAGLPVADHEPPPEFDLHNGIAVLRHAMTWLTAEVVDAHPAGDHTLFIGHLLELAPQLPEQAPLGFFGSTFAHIRPIGGQGSLPLEPWDQVDAWG